MLKMQSNFKKKRYDLSSTAPQQSYKRGIDTRINSWIVSRVNQNQLRDRLLSERLIIPKQMKTQFNYDVLQVFKN